MPLVNPKTTNMKNCSNCKKASENFSPGATQCKPCRKQIARDSRRRNNKTGIFYNYIIEDYTGVSSNIYNRKRTHKFNGKNTENLQVIKAFTSRQEALDYEHYLQDNCGYKGIIGGTSQSLSLNGRAKQICVKNKIYHTIKEAAIAECLTRSQVKYRLKLNSYVDYTYK